jgi:hypothetical protein
MRERPEIPSRANRPPASTFSTGTPQSTAPSKGPPSTKAYGALPSAAVWQKDTQPGRPAGRANDPVLRTIDELLEGLRTAEGGGQLFLLGQLFFTTMAWMNHASKDPRMIPETRPAILSLNLFVGNELARKLNCPLGKLAGKLQQIYGVNMSPHGVDLDTEAVKRNYLSAAKREAYRVFIINGRASHFRTSDDKYHILKSGVDGLGFALSMSNELYVAPVGGLVVKFHSFFMAGMPVQCAGHMWFDNGVVTKVCNSSGHYKPVDQSMVKLLSHLRSFGVDLRKVTVEPVQFRKVGKNVVGQSADDVNGEVFMRNRGNWKAILARGKHQARL